MSRTQRMFDLLSVLRARGRSTVTQLADDLGVSTRTIHRDLADLAEVGVPVVTEPGRYGGVSILPGGRFTVSGLSAREKDLLQITGLDAGRAAQLGQDALARSVVGKLSTRKDAGQPSSRGVGAKALALSEVVTVDNRPWFPAPRREIDVAGLAEDIRTSRRLTISYRRSGESGEQRRVVDPYGLLGRGGRWYLVADREGMPRQYAVERLAKWTVLDEPRRLRPGETLESVVASLARALEQPQDTVTVTAELTRGRLDLARRILGSRLVAVDGGGNDSGAVRIDVAYTQLAGVRQLLQFGDDITVIAPVEARNLVADLARSIVARYRDDGETVDVEGV